MNRLEVFQRPDRKWSWRLIAANNEVIATDGGQAYENREDALSMGTAVVNGEHAVGERIFQIPLDEQS